MSFEEKVSAVVFKSKRFLRKSSPTILTIVGIGGVAATAILSAKATIKAVDILEEVKQGKDEELTTMEKVKAVGPVYIPAIAVGIATAACIAGSNVLNKKQQASLMGSYILLEQTFKEYKDKVIDIHGKEGHEEVVSEIAKDHYPRRSYTINRPQQAAFL